jgi:protein-tyrosine phosphatase
MPGDGCAELGDLDRAADALDAALARPDRSPVFFHCDAGKQRTNAVLAAYRMRIKGWSLEQALDELENCYDFDRQNENELADHLAAYADWLFASGWRPASPAR